MTNEVDGDGSRTMVSNDQWEKLEGTFSLERERMPNRVVFYLEGPSPGVDILIDSVIVSCSDLIECEVCTFWLLFSVCLTF